MDPSLEKKLEVASFGRYLKLVREQKRISLTAVADEIRVGLWQLTLIEAEDHERLPDEVYVKGILRAYSKAIGVDPADILDRYKLNREAYRQSAQAEADILQSGRRSLPRMMLALGVLMIIVCASLYIFNETESKKNQGPDSTSPAVSDTSETAAAQGIDSNQEQESIIQKPEDRLHLVIQAVIETDINVQIDNQQYTKYRLKPNDEVQLAASRRFNLLISDADGVRLRLNGDPVNIPGEPGQSVNLVLTQKNRNR